MRASTPATTSGSPLTAAPYSPPPSTAPSPAAAPSAGARPRSCEVNCERNPGRHRVGRPVRPRLVRRVPRRRAGHRPVDARPQDPDAGWHSQCANCTPRTAARHRARADRPRHRRHRVHHPRLVLRVHLPVGRPRRAHRHDRVRAGELGAPRAGAEGTMTRPRLLDLFCGAGGAAMGYHRAGFDVTGVDNRPQPRYPFTFHQADAMTFPLDGFDAIHASPPCQAFTQMSARWRGKGTKADEHPDLITPTLARLRPLEVPWVVENVQGAVRIMR